MDASSALRIQRFCKQCEREFAPADSETRLCFNCGGLPETQPLTQPDALVRIYDLKSLDVKNVVFLADGKRAVVTDIEAWECENPFDDHGRLPDVRMQKYTVGLWELDSFTRLNTCNVPESARNFERAGLSLSRDQRFVLTGGEYELSLFDLLTGKQAQRFKLTGYSNLSEAVCLSPDGVCAMAGDNIGTVWIWEIASGACLQKLEGNSSRITHLFLLSHTYQLYSVSETGELRLWELISGRCLAAWQTGCAIQAAICTLDDQLLFSTLDGSIQKWDPGVSVTRGVIWHGSPNEIYQGEPECTTALALTPDGNTVLAGGKDGVVRLIELASGQCLRAWQPPGRYARSIAYIACSADGRRTLVGMDNQIQLWEWAEPLGKKDMAASRPEFLNPFKPQPPFEWGAGDIILGGYEILEITRWDGANRYYKACHLSDGLELAMKSPAPARLEGFEALVDYRQEAEILFRLWDVSQVEKIDQARLWHGIPLLLMERIEGCSLGDFICQYDHYTDRDWLLERVLDVAIQLAWGLSCVHRRRIVHTDVKPGYVVITEAGDIKLIGFEFARMIQPGCDTVTIERETISGALVYRSPEQIKGEPLGIKTDLWSWALIVLEMFAGEVIWSSGRFAAEVLEIYLEVGPTVQSAPVMPAMLAALLRQCFQARPEYRPPDMLSIAERMKAIYQHVTGQPYPRSLEFQAEAPQSLETLLARGVSCFELGQYEQAAACLEQAVALDPFCGAAWLSLGFSRLCLDPYSPSAALECFKHGNSPKSSRYTIGQVAEYTGSIWRERVDCARRVVWIERYYGDDIRLGEVGGDFTPYDFRGLNLSPEQLPGCGSPERWFRHQEREREPWVLEVDKPDELGVGYEFVFGGALASAELEICCRKCGIDLSWIANRDGRMQELAGRVEYLCQPCALMECGSSAPGVGPWRLIRTLERSGSEEVHLAWHALTRRVAELHRLPAYIQPGLDFHRFLRQMQIMQDLQHPNLVSLIDSGEEPSNLYFIQDLGVENSLENLVEERFANSGQSGEFSPWRPLSIPEAISCILPVLDGLAYLHDKGYVHRDITPANILRVEQAGRWLTLLSGFQWVYGYNRAGMTIDDEGESAGTLTYMPREQALHFWKCKPTVDLFAVGATLYFLLTAYFPLPFPGWRELKAGVKMEKDPIKILLNESAIPIRQRDPRIPQSLAAVVDKAVCKKAEDRFQTALEFKEALRSAWAEMEADNIVITETSDAKSVAVTIERAATPAPIMRRCAICGEELGAQVDCDGRAAELGDDVMYWCPRCARRRKPVVEVDQHGYKTIETLGWGAGFTELAWHAPTGRAVALRRLHFYRNADENAFQYIEDMHQLSQVAHPALVPVLDAWQSGEDVIAASAYIPGVNLWEWGGEQINSPSIKPEVEKMVFMLDGLIHLKQAGWEHHKIHFWNILLPRANPLRPRLCTADLYRRPYLIDCDDFDLERDPSWDGLVKGWFIPRENILHFKRASPTTDVYAMGVGLYFMLTRKWTFDMPLLPSGKWRDDQIEKIIMKADPIKKILHDEPIPIQQRNPNIPTELAAAIDRAVSRQAEARYTSLEAFREALQSALKLIPS